MSEEISKDYAREIIEKAVDVFVDLIWEEAKPVANLHHIDSEIAISLSKEGIRPATDLLTLILQAALDPSYCFESDFFTNLGKAKPYTTSLFLSNEMMLPIIKSLALIKPSSERAEVVKKLAEQINNRIEKIWLENNLTFHELFSLLESYVKIANVANLTCKRSVVEICDSYASYESDENVINLSKFRILYWAFRDHCLPKPYVRYSLCDALDEYYPKES